MASNIKPKAFLCLVGGTKRNSYFDCEKTVMFIVQNTFEINPFPAVTFFWHNIENMGAESGCFRLQYSDKFCLSQNTFDVNLIDAESREIATLFVNMFISFSYPLNFVIYCCMSHQFRSQFSVTFCRRTPQSADAQTSTRQANVNLTLILQELH